MGVVCSEICYVNVAPTINSYGATVEHFEKAKENLMIGKK
jgi:hypothetical protein